MPAYSQSYYLALDVFALTALLMAAAAGSGRSRRDRARFLLALFLLVVVRSVALIGFMAGGDSLPRLLGSVEILSLFFIIWALVKSSVLRVQLWRVYAGLGVGITVILVAALWQTPGLPWQRLALIVALGGLPLVFSRRDKARWTHTASPLVLAAAVGLNWLGLASVSQFISLMAYGALVYAVFIETAISARMRQQTVESLGAETHRVHSERLRLMEAGNALSAAPNPTEALDHAARTLAGFTRADQIVFVAFVETGANSGRIAAVYSVDNSLHYTSRDDTTFNLLNSPLLLDVLESQQRKLIAAAENSPHLAELYALWQESRVGPTLLQPLLLKHKVVGVLILGNPITQRPLKTDDIRLSQSLAPQLASVVVYQSQYHTLELQTEDLASQLQLARGELQQMLNIVEAIDDGVIVSDVEGKIHLVNEAAQRMLGRPRRELLGKPIGTIYGDITSNESIEKLAAEFSRSNQPLPTFFERHGLSVQGRLIPLRNRRQEWIGMVAYLRNVTAELAADKTKSEFVQTISRELRTPLTTARGYVDLMLNGATGDIDIRQRHFINVIKASIERVTRVVGNATRAAEFEADTIRLTLNPVRVPEVADAAARAASAVIAAGQLTFTADVPANLPPVKADRARLRQVLDSLLLNACHATPPGGQVSLRAWSQSEGLNGQQTEYVIISVSDGGGGLSTTAQRRIFEPEGKAPDALTQIVTPAEAAMPLGKVKEVIGAHGGRVWVESVEDKGSVFHIALPCARGEGGWFGAAE